MNLPCLKCGKPMQLVTNAAKHYAWQCSGQCLPSIDTGITSDENITLFQRTAISDGKLNTPIFTKPLTSDLLVGAKVYAPQTLWHFIECSWGACYNSIYQNFLVPHFDSVPVLDYVLRSPVVSGELKVQDGVPAPKIFPELLWRLQGVKSSKIQEYLKQTFPQQVK